jgi:hypothetical protein
MTPRVRSTLVVLVGLAITAWAANRVAQSSELDPTDFIEYWASGAVAVRGGNPYDPAELLPWQRAVEPDRDIALMMWNPPWSLAIYMPLGALPLRWAMLVWVGVQLLSAMAASHLIWRAYGGEWRRSWVAQAVGISFAPVVWMVLFGQNTGLLALGLAGFLYFHKADRPALAGAFAALTALKPHLLAVFGVLLILDVITRRGRIAFASGVAVLAAFFAIALTVNPEVFHQYREAFRDPGAQTVPLDAFVLPVASYWLRMTIAPAQFWVQFVPCVIACLGYAVYRFQQGRRWGWNRELPRIMWVSVIFTPYGGWIFDLTVLLVPVIQASVWVAEARRWRLAAALGFGHLAITAVTLIWIYTLPEFFWVVPAALALYVASWRATHSRSSVG